MQRMPMKNKKMALPFASYKNPKLAAANVATYFMWVSKQQRMHAKANKYIARTNFLKFGAPTRESAAVVQSSAQSPIFMSLMKIISEGRSCAGGGAC
mmetsp:Transcript_3243/g.5034  ORF Transcript_3243/g.5034 Transcript_3243/m.5034 type:complete len:97 (-) Transcript_3243:299-589(-)